MHSSLRIAHAPTHTQLVKIDRKIKYKTIVQWGGWNEENERKWRRMCWDPWMKLKRKYNEMLMNNEIDIACMEI